MSGMRRPCLSVTVKTTLTSLIGTRIVVTEPALPPLPAPCVLGSARALGATVGFDDDDFCAAGADDGAGVDGADDCAVAATAQRATRVRRAGLSKSFVPKVCVDIIVASAA